MMEQHNILKAISLLKMAIRVPGMPKSWIAANSVYWSLLKDYNEKFLIDSNGNNLTVRI